MLTIKKQVIQIKYSNSLQTVTEVSQTQTTGKSQVSEKAKGPQIEKTLYRSTVGVWKNRSLDQWKEKVESADEVTSN